MRHLARLAAFALAAIVAAAPASAAAQKVFAGVVPATFLKRWSPNEWHIWALPNGQCLALSQDTSPTSFDFWGFRQSPGSRIDLIFHPSDRPRPRTVQMSFNDGGKFDYDARVERFLDWDAYVISIQGNALSIFHDQTFIASYVNDKRVFWGITNAMRNVEKNMAKCLDYQRNR